MKNLFIFDETANSLQNGIGTYIADLKKFLADVVEVSVFAFNDSVTDYRKEVRDNVTYYRFPVFCGGSFLDNCEIGLTVLRLEIADAPDNVFLFNYFLCNDLLRAVKKYFPLSKTVFVIHDQIWTTKLLGDSRKLRNIMRDSVSTKVDQYLMTRGHIDKEREMYDLADRIVTVSKDTLGLLKSVYRINREKISFIPHGKKIRYVHYDPRTKEAIKKKLLLHADDRIMLYVGRTTRCKGFHATLSAFEKVSPLFPQVKLVVLGRVHDITEVAGLCPRSKTNIIFAGRVGKEELKRWYQVADVGLVPSYCEQCGYAGIEMLAYGLPIIASDGLGVRKMFQHGYNAMVARIGNREKPEVFVRNSKHAMITLLEMSNEHLDRLRANARRTYLDKYAVSGMKEAYIKLIDELTGTGNGGCAVLPPLNVEQKEELIKLVLSCNDLYSRGLFRGRMGVVMALMEYCDKISLGAIGEFCLFTIERSIDNLPNNTDIGLATGIAGIGWVLDYLKRRELLDTDTAEICKEIDKRLMQFSPLRMDDLSLDKGLEGLLMYFNLHLLNNRGKKVFDDSYIEEIKTVLRNLPANVCENLKKQASLFNLIVTGELCELNTSPLQFVADVYDKDITLQHGLAGKLLNLALK